jgi:REP-associated tyrosine transposase
VPGGRHFSAADLAVTPILAAVRDQVLQFPSLMARPPRISGISYKGRETYLVTMVTRERVKAFGNLDFGRIAQQELLHHASKESFALPAYSLMPDHVHYVATGTASESDLRRFVASWKQATGYQWSRLGNGRLWQPGFWDRRARFEEPLIEMVRYVVENPVRAKLVAYPTEYPLTGSTEYTIEQICDDIRTFVVDGRH